MKIVKIIFLILLILIIVVIVGTIIFLKTFNINNIKPQLTQKIETLLDRNVHLGEMRLSLSWQKGANLEVFDVSVSDDPAFSLENFLTSQKIYLGLDIFALIKNREVVINKISVEAPAINIIRNAQGQFNVSTLGKKNIARKAAPGLKEGEQWQLLPKLQRPWPFKESEAEAASGGDFNFIIHTVFFQHAIVNYIDKTFSPPLKIAITDIAIKAHDFRFKEFFPVQVQGSIWSTVTNIQEKGSIKIDPANKEVVLKSWQTDVNLDSLQWPEAVRALEGIPFFANIESFSGKLRKEISNATINFTDGLVRYNARTDLTKGHIKLASLQAPFDNITLSLQATEEKIKVITLKSSFANGEISGMGEVSHYLQSPAFSGEIQLKDISLEDIQKHDVAAQDIYLGGKCSGNFRFSGQGMTKEKLRETLEGKGEIFLKEGQLKNVNVLRVVLEKLSFLPDLVEKLENNLSEKYKKILQQNDTALQKAHVVFLIKGSKILVEQSTALMDGFQLEAKGQVDSRFNILMDADIFILQDLTKDMTATVEELSYLTDEKGQIWLPVQIQGKYPHITFYPDITFLSKKIFQRKGRKELNKLLDKAFGDEADSGEGQKEGGMNLENNKEQPPQKEESSPEKEIINSILDAVFGQ